MNRINDTVISREQLFDLLEYSCTVPTGVVGGKRWRRASRYGVENPDWLIGEYVVNESGSPTGAVRMVPTGRVVRLSRSNICSAGSLFSGRDEA